MEKHSRHIISRRNAVRIDRHAALRAAQDIQEFLLDSDSPESRTTSFLEERLLDLGETMRKILILSHRDIGHIDGGGAPLYVHEIFKRLTHRYDVTILSTAQGKIPPSETLDDIRIVR